MAGQRPLALKSGVATQINDPDQIQVPSGSASAPGLVIATSSGFFSDVTNSGIGISVAGAQLGWFAAGGPVYQLAGGGAIAINLRGEGSTVSTFARYSNDVGSANTAQMKARGTIASPSVPQNGDNLGTSDFQPYTGAAFATSARIAASLTETSTVDPTHMGSRFRFLLCPVGSGTLTEVARLENETGLSMFGANPVIDQNRVFRPRSYTVATVPAISGTTGFIYVSDEGGGGCNAYADPVANIWRRTSDLQALTASTPTGRGLLGRMTSRVAYVNQDIVQRTYAKLSAAGLLTKLLGLWVFAGAPTSQADALRNWITLGTRDLTVTGSPTWSQTGGFTGDGSTALLNTGAAIATFGGAQNNLTVGVYILAANTGSAKAVIGNASGARNIYLQSFTSGALTTRFQINTNDSYTPSKYTGMFVLTRGASANYQASVDDGAQTTITRNSNSPGNIVTFLGTTDTTASEFSNAQIAFAFIGPNLSTTDIANLRAIMVDYYLVQTAVLSSTYLVANLPGNTAAFEGQRLMVSDSNVAASGNFGATLTGGGSNHVPCYYESGTPAWRIG